MSSIIRKGETYHGISVFGRGVFTHDDENGRRTYAGQHRDGYACGLGVLTWSDGRKEYAEHSPDGQYDGRYFGRYADGHIVYNRFERGKQKANAHVFADGSYGYNFEACAPDDPRFLSLIAQVAPVEVRRAARVPQPPSPRHSPPSNPPMCRLGSLQALAKTMASEVHPHATRRRWWPCRTTQRQPRCTDRPQTVNGEGWRASRVL
jgi:hypothetical protein